MGFNLESAKVISGVRLQRDGFTFYLRISSRLVTPLDRYSATQMAEQDHLRRKWGSDLKTRVAFAREFTFENLPQGSYQVRYDAARDGTKSTIYSFLVD